MLRAMDEALPGPRTRDRGRERAGDVSRGRAGLRRQRTACPTPSAFDGRREVFKAWLGFGLPTHYFLDGDGIIRERHYGPMTLAQAAHDRGAAAGRRERLARASPRAARPPSPHRLRSPSGSPTG